MTRSVLITRPKAAAEEFAARLKREGIAGFVAPLMEYRDLNVDLTPVKECQAIIFTSAQGASVFCRNTDFRDLPVFAVGEATAQAARKNGFIRVYTAAGDGRDLAALVASRKTSLDLQKIFHASGEDVAEDLGRLLSPEGIAVMRMALYKADIIERFSPEIEDALLNGQITTVTLFSSRTAESFAKIMQAEKLAAIAPKLEIVCLSSRIADEVRKTRWRVLRVARTPHIQSVLEILRERDARRAENGVLLAEPVIAAFGGLRPLANRLGLTASTVQGWKERGIIPEARLKEVLSAADEDDITLDGYWRENRKDMTDDKNMPGATAKERRQPGRDRRQQKPLYDDRGHVVSPHYLGPDRRSGRDRRADQLAERQQAEKEKRIRAEKWRFFNRTVLSAGFLGACLLYAGVFLMAPEYLRLESDAEQIRAMEEKMAAMHLEMEEMKKTSAPIGAKISHGIEEIGNAVSTVTDSVGTAAATLQEVDAGAGVRQLLQVLSNLTRIGATAEGRAGLEEGMRSIRAILSSATANPDNVNAAIDDVRERNPAMKSVLGHVDRDELAAAAMLLTLNEFRANIDSQRPFEDDLAIMRRFAGDDPEMQRALGALAPYAKSGVLSRGRLQQEFKAVAGDIVMAKLQGEDATVKDKVMQRLAKLVKVRKAGDIAGDTPDAIVARAQLKLEQNDVKGALAELQQLEGESAEAAAPFMQQAQGNVLAEDSSAMVMQVIMNQLASPSGFSLEKFFGGFMPPTGMNTAPSPYVSPSMQGGNR